MPSYALYKLRDLRLAGERRAEQALAEAAAALRRAAEERDRLQERVAAARTAEAAARAGEAEPPATAGAAQTRQRYRTRLQAETRACLDALGLHVARLLEPAARAEAEARAAHLRARQRREVIEKAIARREAEGRLVRARRAEADADDLTSRRRP